MIQEKRIRKEITVNASIDRVWKAWTTAKFAVDFFAPKANIELIVGGPYELLFDLDAPVGSQGSEGVKVLSYLPEEMLSFEWSAPPEFPTVRKQRTWVVVQFSALDNGKTRVRLTHLGWREGEEWNKVFEYFKRAWDVVLGRLQYMFVSGPIDWKDPYRPPAEITFEVS